MVDHPNDSLQEVILVGISHVVVVVEEEEDDDDDEEEEEEDVVVVVDVDEIG